MWKQFAPMAWVLIFLGLQLEHAIRAGSTLRAWVTGAILLLAVVAVIFRVIRLTAG